MFGFLERFEETYFRKGVQWKPTSKLRGSRKKNRSYKAKRSYCFRIYCAYLPPIPIIFSCVLRSMVISNAAFLSALVTINQRSVITVLHKCSLKVSKTRVVSFFQLTKNVLHPYRSQLVLRYTLRPSPYLHFLKHFCGEYAPAASRRCAVFLLPGPLLGRASRRSRRARNLSPIGDALAGPQAGAAL